MKLQQFITVMVSTALVVQLNACAYLPKDVVETISTATGGILGGTVADKVADNAPSALRPVITAMGVMVGAELGKQLGKYLSEQDQKKWQEQVDIQVQDPKPQTFVTCTNDQNPYRNVSMEEASNLNCGEEKKVILTSSATNNINGQECKTMQTEIADTEKPLETIDYQICKGSDGKWHEKSV